MAHDIDQRLRDLLLPKKDDKKDAKPIDNKATDSNPDVEPDMVEIS